MRTRIKICCIASLEEARMAIEAGADAVGLVGKMPSGPGPIQDELIAAIAEKIHPPIATFLLTSEQDPEQVITHVKKVNTNTVQIVDELNGRAYDKIRQALPFLKLVQVIHVTGPESIEQASAVAKHVDALLLDSGNPKARIKSLGGTGNTHDWAISRKIVEKVKLPVFLAGGLHEGNVREAIMKVRPFAVDVCSGVRTDGRLDPQKLLGFVGAVSS